MLDLRIRFSLCMPAMSTSESVIVCNDISTLFGRGGIGAAVLQLSANLILSKSVSVSIGTSDPSLLSRSCSFFRLFIIRFASFERPSSDPESESNS